MKAAKAERNAIKSASTGKVTQVIGLPLYPLRQCSQPGKWLLLVLCLDVLWLGFVRLPSLLGRDPWLDVAGHKHWIPVLISMLFVPVEVYLAWLILAHQHKEKLAAGRTSALMNKVLSDSTPWQWATDAAGRFTYCGPGSLNLVGYEPSELVGHHFSRIIDPEDLAAVLQDRSRKTDATGDWAGVRTIYRHRLGGRVMVDISAKARTGADGEYLGLEGRTRSLRPETITGAVAGQARWRVQTLIEEEDLSTAFQPVWSLSSGKPVGVEALTRFPGSVEPPDVHFAEAFAVGLGSELELAALKTALNAGQELPEHLYIAVNLSPDVCLDPQLPELLCQSQIPPQRIVVEVTERHAVAEYASLCRALEPLRNSGVRLAVDDAGAGFASMRHILELAPDMIKLDRDVIAGIDADPARQALGTAMVGFAAGIGAQLVAEGIETAEELAMVTRMGMDAGQGYLLGRPSLNCHDWARWNTGQTTAHREDC